MISENGFTGENTVIPYPTTSGWVTTLESKLDHLLVDYLSTNYGQSIVFQGHVKSFQYTLAHYGHEPHSCAEAVESDLNYLLGAYFKRHSTSVKYQDISPGSSGYQLMISISVSDGQGDAMKVNRLFETEDTNYVKVMKVNNEGQTYSEMEYYYDNRNKR